MDLIFLIGRLLFGGYFLMNGLNHLLKAKMMTAYARSKGVPAAGLGVFGSGLMIILGGAGIIAGVYIRLAVLLIVVFLLVVSFQMHNFWAIKDEQAKAGEMINFLKNLALLGAALMMLAISEPWPLSL